MGRGARSVPDRLNRRTPGGTTVTRTTAVVATVLVVVALSATPATAHHGPGILVGPDGTVYFVMTGPFPVMMIRPGGEPEPATPALEPTWVHHLVWLADGRIAAADHEGVLWVIEPGVSAVRYFTTESIERLRTSDALPRDLYAETRERIGIPRGLRWRPVYGGRPRPGLRDPRFERPAPPLWS